MKLEIVLVCVVALCSVCIDRGQCTAVDTLNQHLKPSYAQETNKLKRSGTQPADSRHRQLVNPTESQVDSDPEQPRSSGTKVSESASNHNREKRFLDEAKELFGMQRKTKAEILKEVERYHDCLKARKEGYQRHKGVGGLAEAKAIAEGERTVLRCGVCLSPAESFDKYTIHWYKYLLVQPPNANTIATLINPSDDKHFKIIDEANLVLKEPFVEDSGLYTCVVDGATQNIYYLDVVKRQKWTQVVEAPMEGKEPARDAFLDDNNLMIYTEWDQWGPCSKCGKRGIRRRRGYCILKKIEEGRPVQPDDFLQADRHWDGVPCQSTLVPASVAAVPTIAQRPNEVHNAYCWHPCATKPPLQTITDRNGQVVEVVEVSKGFVSIREGRLPTLPPLIKRRTYYKTAGKSATVTCPDDKAKFSAVSWQNGSMSLDISTIRRRTKGRVSVDANNNLVIHKLTKFDTAPYSCWLEHKHIATVKIVVVDAVDKNTDDYVIFIGVGLTVVALFCVAVQLVRLQHQNKHNMR